MILLLTLKKSISQVVPSQMMPSHHIIIAVPFYVLRLQIIYIGSFNWAFQNQVDLALCAIGSN